MQACDYAQTSAYELNINFLISDLLSAEGVQPDPNKLTIIKDAKVSE